MDEGMRIPLYDTLDGFSRRKRLRDVGRDPDVEVSMEKYDTKKGTVGPSKVAKDAVSASP